LCRFKPVIPYFKNSQLNTKNILVIDNDSKQNNDRTWCYWEKETGIFESIVHAKWQKLAYKSTDFNRNLNLGAYTYKMILGIDFYNFVLQFAKQFTNVTFCKETVVSINSTKNTTTVTTDKNTYKSNYTFNSTPIFNPKINKSNSLLQHFTGWVIDTEQPQFNTEIGTLMDFNLPQHHGATFMYVLPTSPKKALVEYTIFGPEVLSKATYKKELEHYITNTLSIKNYSITHTEFGIIPMSLATFNKTPKPNVINIGTAGGFTKASSGYTFQFIQKDTAALVSALAKNQPLNTTLPFRQKLFNWYDKTLLDVLLSDKKTGKDIFDIIFKKIMPKLFLPF
jgi:Lycopene cyclase protein.